MRQLGAKTNRANDAHRVFAVARGRVTNQFERALFAVLHALVVVHHDLRFGVVVHSVYRKVTARGIFVLRAPHVVAQHTATSVYGVLHTRQFSLGCFLVAAYVFCISAFQISAEGRHFDHFMLAPTAKHHVHDTKAPADDEGAAEQVFDLFWRGIGGYVEVFGAQAQQQVAHRATHDVGFKACVFKGGDDFPSAVVYQRAVNAVFTLRYVYAFAEFVFDDRRLGAEQFVNEFFYHVQRSKIRQPRCAARVRKRASGLVATGVCTFSKSGRSFMLSL